jgi:hypothetical protein
MVSIALRHTMMRRTPEIMTEIETAGLEGGDDMALSTALNYHGRKALRWERGRRR